MVKSGIDVVGIQRAIVEVERWTSGAIYLSVAPFFWGSVQTMAENAFVRFGMSHTPERNAVLFVVVPWRRRFVVMGDTGIHEKLGQSGWDRVAWAMAQRCRAGDLTGGLEAAVLEMGAHLATHFPRKPNLQDQERSLSPCATSS